MMTRDEYIAVAKSLPQDVWDQDDVDDDMLAELGKKWTEHLDQPDFTTLLKIRNDARGLPKSLKQ